MDLTIASLKIGDRIVLGKYGTPENAPEPIVWLKADRDGSLLSEKVLDYLQIDAPERTNDPYHRNRGNNCYALSNIHQFLNSYEEDWYLPTHDGDVPPASRDYRHSGAYRDYDGFLCAFEDYEIEAIGQKVNLPSFANIYGQGGQSRFELFKRRGVRPKASNGFLYSNGSRWFGLNETSFCEFWLSDEDGEYYNKYVDKSGYTRSAYPHNPKGIRPVCKISLDTKVAQNEDGTYSIVPFEPTKKRDSNVCTDEELMAFMGLTV